MRYPAYDFILCDLDQDELNLEKPFDTILLAAVIEHLEHPSHLVAQLPRYLKAEGRLVVTTPTPFGDKIHQVGARVGLFSKAAMEEHETIFSYKMMVELLEPVGLVVERYQRFLFGGNQLFICKAKAVNS